jgi:outer membrane protein assembly factor BamD
MHPTTRAALRVAPGAGPFLDLPGRRRYRPLMRCRTVYLLLLTAVGVVFPLRSPAPLVYTPGQGWVYKSYGSMGDWRRERAKDQLEVAQEAFEQKDYAVARRAANYLLRQWPLSDYAPDAQFLLARCLEAEGHDEKAFHAYQKLFTDYPKSDKLEAAMRQQYQIAMRFLEGQRFKLWGVIPFFPNMEKTAGLFEQIVQTGPYSQAAPHAQLRIGAAFERKRDYPQAVTAYERAADRYHDRPIIAADALYRAAICYTKQARRAEYDQGTAGQAIATFTDLITLHPEDKRVAEARRTIASLKVEQARGNFKIAEFYAKQRQWAGALIYYNEVLLSHPDTRLAEAARERITLIRERVAPEAE